MPVVPGTRLGPYEVLAPVGAGGMGEVYKARDTRLDRIVAIKVLPAQFAADPQFRERFEREARAVAALNHPHICTLHNVGRQDGIDYLVMEYLEGQTLAERLEKGALPLDQSLRYAIQMADALDKAHRQGITHRDLKPGNIMLTKSGVKLLDFGLAKLAPAAPFGIAGTSAAATQTAPLTGQGTILGTLQYMAPEQLEDKEADARTDIFAFGAVVYEMLTGKKAFEGKSSASLIAAILEHEPPSISSVQPLSPPALDRVVKKCLAKEPEKRWQSASDLTDELKWIAEGAAVSTVALITPRARRRERIAWAIATAALVVTAAVGGAATLYLRRSAPEALPTRFEIVTPPTNDPVSLALSTDGRQIAFVANGDAGSRLWVRPLDRTDARPLNGTEGASYPFWAPDGRAIGFFADGKLKRIDLAGGTAVVLANAPAARGGAWNGNGVILFTPLTISGLQRVAASGGTPEPVTHLTAGQVSHRWPQFLPDGRRFLYLAALGRPETNGVYVEKPSSGAGAERSLLVTPENKATLSWSPDDRFLLYRSVSPNTGSDLLALAMSDALRPFDKLTVIPDAPSESRDDRKPIPIAQATFDETEGQFSPDGRLTAVSIAFGAGAQALALSAPVPLFPTRLATGSNVTGVKPQYAVAPDGRFLLDVTVDEATGPPITVVLNWAAGLKK